jgi:hypothetical protein
MIFLCLGYVLADPNENGVIRNKERITIREGHTYLSCDVDGAEEPCEPGVDALERAAGAETSVDISDRVRRHAQFIGCLSNLESNWSCSSSVCQGSMSCESDDAMEMLWQGWTQHVLTICAQYAG